MKSPLFVITKETIGSRIELEVHRLAGSEDMIVDALVLAARDSPELKRLIDNVRIKLSSYSPVGGS